MLKVDRSASAEGEVLDEAEHWYENLSLLMVLVDSSVRVWFLRDAATAPSLRHVEGMLVRREP